MSRPLRGRSASPQRYEEGGGAAGIANPIASDPQRESDASAVQSESFAEFDRGGSSIMGGLPSTDDDSRAPSAHVEMREMRETMGASSMGRTSAAAEAASDNPLRSSAAPPPTDSGAAEMAQPSTDAPSDGALWKAKAAQLRADAGERFAPLSEVTSKLAAANSAEDFFKRLRELDPRQKRTLGLTALCIFFVLLLLIVIPAAANSGAGDGDAYDPRASHLITADSSVALAGVAPDDAAAIGDAERLELADAVGSALVENGDLPDEVRPSCLFFFMAAGAGREQNSRHWAYRWATVEPTASRQARAAVNLSCSRPVISARQEPSGAPLGDVAVFVVLKRGRVREKNEPDTYSKMSPSIH